MFRFSYLLLSSRFLVLRVWVSSWLLQRFGATVHLSRALVRRPSHWLSRSTHVVLIVTDSLGRRWMLDPGFGDSPRIALDLAFKSTAQCDALGDEFRVFRAVYDSIDSILLRTVSHDYWIRPNTCIHVHICIYICVFIQTP